MILNVNGAAVDKCFIHIIVKKEKKKKRSSRIRISIRDSWSRALRIFLNETMKVMRK